MLQQDDLDRIRRRIDMAPYPGDQIHWWDCPARPGDIPTDCTCTALADLEGLLELAAGVMVGRQAEKPHPAHCGCHPAQGSCSGG